MCFQKEQEPRTKKKKELLQRHPLEDVCWTGNFTQCAGLCFKTEGPLALCAPRKVVLCKSSVYSGLGVVFGSGPTVCPEQVTFETFEESSPAPSIQFYFHLVEQLMTVSKRQCTA